MALDERKRKILTAVVKAYIETGEPVGSKTLMRLDSDINVSSATIRNDMSELERMGYLCKPHTSAGRIPSSEGYRYYVETTEEYSLSEFERKTLTDNMESCVGLYDTINEVASRLADFTGCAVFAVAPTAGNGILTFEVLPAGKRTVALLAISDNGSVKTCLAKSEKDVDADDAQKLTKVFNSVLSGFPADQISKLRMSMLENTVEKEFGGYKGVVEAAYKLVEQLKSYELAIQGGSNLLAYPEFADAEVAREYVDILSKHEQLMQTLMEQKPEGEFTVQIGSENKLFGSMGASLVSVECRAKIPVYFGIVGPSRLDYVKLKSGSKYLMQKLKKFIDEEL